MINEGENGMKIALTSRGRVVRRATPGPADGMTGVARWREIWLRLRAKHTRPAAAVLTVAACIRKVALTGWSIQDDSRLWGEIPAGSSSADTNPSHHLHQEKS